MTGIPMEHGLALAAVLFSLGLTGLMIRRNILYVLMSLAILLQLYRRFRTLDIDAASEMRG